MLAFFHFSGKHWFLKQFLKRTDKGFAIEEAHNFIIGIDIPSCPGTLFGSNNLIILTISSVQNSKVDSFCSVANLILGGQQPTRITHEFDPQEWPTSVTHENAPRVWPTRITHKFDPREWPTGLTHENDPRVWPTRMSHETHVTHMIKHTHKNLFEVTQSHGVTSIKSKSA